MNHNLQGMQTNENFRNQTIQNYSHMQNQKENREENIATKMGMGVNKNSQNFNKPLTNNRAFGKVLTNSTINQINYSSNLNERRNLGNNKQMNFFKPMRNEKEGQKKKSEISLYNLRPRGNSMNSSRNNSNNNSLVINNENINTMNENMQVNERGRLRSSDMDVEMICEKETQVTQISDLSYKSHMSSSSQGELILPNPQYASEYLEEIYEYLRSIENDLMSKYGYMAYQKDINEKMRAILIDWLIDVHLRFKLVPETLFLTTYIIDRYLEKKEISRSKLQLVGVASLFIACKYEEIHPPELKDFVYITDKAYSKDDILEMEKEVLNELEFSITSPSSLRFLEFYIQLLQIKFDEQTLLFARYLLELFLVEYRMLKYSPSCVAAATLYITIRVKKINYSSKSLDISRLSGYSENKLKECAKDICIILDNADKSSLQAVKNKYSSPKFFQVAKWMKN